MFPIVIQAFGQAEPSAPGQAAALWVAERAAAKPLLTAPVHSGQVEDSLLEEPQRGSSPVLGYRAGWILSIPRNERLMVLPSIQSMRPPPPRPGPTPLLPISLPRQHPRHVPEPLQQAFSCVLPGGFPNQPATTELRLFEGGAFD